MDSYQFPRQNILVNNASFSPELLQSLLDRVYSAEPPFTGYIRFSGFDSLHFLLFFNGAPYAAGKFEDNAPGRFTFQELGGHLVKFGDAFMSVTLCETNPDLLNSMLHFLQEEPDVKAPTSELDLDHMVKQIGETGTDALIALSRADMMNFFSFKGGKWVSAYYSDRAFKQPAGMTPDEAMQLYAFQPGTKVQAYVYRNLHETKPETPCPLDRDSLYKLLTVGYLKDRRSAHGETVPVPVQESGNAPDKGKSQIPGVELVVESGPRQGTRFQAAIPCTIGRKDCDLILDDRIVSRHHAALKFVGGDLVIEDLASTNGTRVNNEKITTKQLYHNDLIYIGPFKLRLMLK